MRSISAEAFAVDHPTEGQAGRAQGYLDKGRACGTGWSDDDLADLYVETVHAIEDEVGPTPGAVVLYDLGESLAAVDGGECVDAAAVLVADAVA